MGLELYRDYTREQVHDVLAPDAPFTPGAAQWGLHGIIRLPDRPADFVFFVSYGRQIAGHEFDEGVTADGVLSWQSQPSQGLEDPQIRELIHHDEHQANIHLFLRTSTRATPYTYLGRLKYLRHDAGREKPVYFQWQILEWEPPAEMLDRMGLVLEPPAVPDPDVADLGQEVPPPERSRQIGGKGVTTESFRSLRAPDWGAQEAKNRKLGLAGELFVMAWERRRLASAGRTDLAAEVRHVAVEVGDGEGYDVLSYTAEGERRYIEVKTTRGPAESDFFMSENERRFSELAGGSYCLYRVFAFDEELGAGDLYVVEGPVAESFDLRPAQYRVRR